MPNHLTNTDRQSINHSTKHKSLYNEACQDQPRLLPIQVSPYSSKVFLRFIKFCIPLIPKYALRKRLIYRSVKSLADIFAQILARTFRW